MHFFFIATFLLVSYYITSNVKICCFVVPPCEIVSGSVSIPRDELKREQIKIHALHLLQLLDRMDSTENPSARDKVWSIPGLRSFVLSKSWLLQISGSAEVLCRLWDDSSIFPSPLYPISVSSNKCYFVVPNCEIVSGSVSIHGLPFIWYLYRKHWSLYWYSG